MLKRLFEVPGLPVYDLPPPLPDLYDGSLGFGQQRVYANFVASVDGVTALPSEPNSPSIISGKSEADRFVMGLLRSCCGAIVVGAGTVRAEPEHRWTPEFIFPPAAEAFAGLRRRLGLAAQPELVIVTASGDLDPEVSALRNAALIITTVRGAAKLGSRVRRGSTVLPLGDAPVSLSDVMSVIRERGHTTILTEGGPTLLGGLLAHGLVDELFLTISPLLAGRPRGEDRPGLVEGVDLVAADRTWGKLLSARRHRSHLFLRYSLRPGQA